MIEITPAILTNDIIHFKHLFQSFQSEFTSIDLDIIRPPFVERDTLQLDQIVDIISEYKGILGIHLMVDDPVKDVRYLLDTPLVDTNLRIYIHQEIDEGESLVELAKYNDTPPEPWKICLAVELESELLNLEFYQQYFEVQIMSVNLGAQGQPFDERSIQKIHDLRDMGFEGRLSLDGGINLDTAVMIKDLPIDRISVGSYFTKAHDVSLAKGMLADRLSF